MREKSRFEIKNGIKIMDKTLGALLPGDVVVMTGDNQTYRMGFCYSIIADMLANEETSLIIYTGTEAGKEQSPGCS